MYKMIRLVLTLLLLAGSTAWTSHAAFAQENGLQVRITQVDNSRFPQVIVYVSVTDASGQPIGVDPASITIFENGQAMQAARVNSGGGDKGPGILTTLLVVDVSGSMENGNKLAGAQAAARTYVDQMRPGDQAGVVAFNTDVEVIQAVTSEHSALRTAIDSLKPFGNTAMFEALLKSVQTLTDVSGRKAIILLTDGIDNRSKAKEQDVINAIGPSGLTISTIGLGDPKEAGNNYGLDEPALMSLANRAGGVYSFATDPAALASVYQTYGQALQSEYAFSYNSPSTLRDGINRSLTVSLAGGSVSASGQYNPGGVLPEVQSRSWPMFAAILVGLLALLAVPMLVGRGLQALGGSTKKSRVRLGQAPGTSAKGRIRIK